MSRRVNTILSVASFLVTATLLVILVLAWYTSNQIVTARNLSAMSGTDTYAFQFYYWNETTPKNSTTRSGEWVETRNSLSVNDAQPDDVFYFKVSGTGLTESQAITMIFRGISSELDTNVVKSIYNPTTTKYEVRYNGVKTYDSLTTEINVDYDGDDLTLYNITDANTQNDTYVLTKDTTFASGKDYYKNTSSGYVKQTVTVGAAVTANTYYEKATGYDLELDEIKIEDVIMIYNQITLTTVGTVTDAPNTKGTSKLAIDQQFFNYEVKESDDGKKSFYFALSFDSTGDSTDNYYQYQKLILANVNINVA